MAIGGKTTSYVRPCFSEGDITYNQIIQLMSWLNTQDMKGIFRTAIAELYAQERQKKIRLDISAKNSRFSDQHAI